MNQPTLLSDITCAVEACDNPPRARGVCDSHYVRPNQLLPCSIDDCLENRFARSWCKSHYNRWRRYGDPLKSGGPQRGQLLTPKTCLFLGCETQTRASRGLCVTHRKRNANLIDNYGIDWREYDRMVVAQCGQCAICGDLPPEGEFLVVDHHHDRGAVRGLLCHPCNWALGHLKEDLSNFRAAVRYLETH